MIQITHVKRICLSEVAADKTKQENANQFAIIWSYFNRSCAKTAQLNLLWHYHIITDKLIMLPRTALAA